MQEITTTFKLTNSHNNVFSLHANQPIDASVLMQVDGVASVVTIDRYQQLVYCGQLFAPKEVYQCAVEKLNSKDVTIWPHKPS